MRIKGAKDYYDSGVAAFGVPAESMVDDTVVYVRRPIPSDKQCVHWPFKNNAFTETTECGFDRRAPEFKGKSVQFIVAGVRVFPVWTGDPCRSGVPVKPEHETLFAKFGLTHDRFPQRHVPILPQPDQLQWLLRTVGAPGLPGHVAQGRSSAHRRVCPVPRGFWDRQNTICQRHVEECLRHDRERHSAKPRQSAAGGSRQ